jgi:hypothetical protein
MTMNYYTVVLNEEEDDESIYSIQSDVPMAIGEYIHGPNGGLFLIDRIEHILNKEVGVREDMARYSSTRVFAVLDII